jgi:hypothetical protein
MVHFFSAFRNSGAGMMSVSRLVGVAAAVATVIFAPSKEFLNSMSVDLTTSIRLVDTARLFPPRMLSEAHLSVSYIWVEAVG